MKIEDIDIGASESAAPLGLDEFKSPTRFFMEKTGRVDRDGDSIAAFLGRELEVALMTCFEKDHGVKTEPWPTQRSLERPWLRATPDRVVMPENMPDSFRSRFGLSPRGALVVEGKTTGLASYKPPSTIDAEWGPDGSDIVPARHVIQTLVQGHVLNEGWEALGIPVRVEAIVVKALLPGRGAPDFFIPISQGTTDKIINGLDDFVHEYLVPDIAPEAVSEKDWMLLVEANRRPSKGKDIVKAAPAVEQLALEYRTIADFEKEVKTSKQRLKAHLLQFIGDHYGLSGSFGKIIHTAGKTAPALQKAIFADEVVTLARRLIASKSEGANKLGEMLVALERKHTKATTRGRQVRAYWSDGGENEQENDDE